MFKYFYLKSPHLGLTYIFDRARVKNLKQQATHCNLFWMPANYVTDEHKQAYKAASVQLFRRSKSERRALKNPG